MAYRLQRVAIHGACMSAALLMAGPMAFGKESDAGLHLEGKPNPVSAADALSMRDLREVCLVPQNYNAHDLLRGFGNRAVTGRTIPSHPDYLRKMKANEVGIFAITDQDQKLVVVDLAKMPLSTKRVEGSCFRAESVQFWHWPNGSWDLSGRHDLLIIP